MTQVQVTLGASPRDHPNLLGPSFLGYGGLFVGLAHWKTTTFVGGLRLGGMTAPMLLDGAMNGAAFLAYVEQVLVPSLNKGDIVVMDNR